MILQLLVNHYHESEKIVKRFLDSIERQVQVPDGEFELVLFSDGSDVVLGTGLFEGYSFPIVYRVEPHRGVCGTRNALLDYSSAEYVMFCDIDDEFHSTFGLYWLMKAIWDTGSNIIGSPYEAEIQVQDKLQYIREVRDTIRLHGKIFRRQYLVDKDIRFPDELPYSGDMYFLWQAYNLEQNYAWLRESFYVWKYNPNSITRKDPFARVKTYPLVLRNYELLGDNLLERGRTDLFDMLAASVLCMAYLDASNPDFMSGPVEYLADVNAALTKAVKCYASTVTKMSDQTLKLHYDNALKLHPEAANTIGFAGFRTWISEVQRQ